MQMIDEINELVNMSNYRQNEAMLNKLRSDINQFVDASNSKSTIAQTTMTESSFTDFSALNSTLRNQSIAQIQASIDSYTSSIEEFKSSSKHPHSTSYVDNDESVYYSSSTAKTTLAKHAAKKIINENSS